MSKQRNNHRQRTSSLPLVFYLDLLDQIKSAKQIEQPLSNVDEVVTKFNDKGGFFLDTVWSILVNWGDLKRFQHHYELFKKAALADFKFFVQTMNSAYTVAHMPAKNPDRKVTLKVVNNVQLFDLPNCGIHVRNIVKFFQSVTADLPDNTTKDADSLNLVRVLIYIIIHTFRILAIENRPPDPQALNEHVHGPDCAHEHHHHHHDHAHDHDHAHEHGHEHAHDHAHEHGHVHGPDCAHEHHHHEHASIEEQGHVHGPDCAHEHHHHHHDDPDAVAVQHTESNNNNKNDVSKEESHPKENKQGEGVNDVEESKKETPKVLPFKEKECVQCGSQASTKCSACLEVYYCSRDCQKKDWPSHKSVCASLKKPKSAAGVTNPK